MIDYIGSPAAGAYQPGACNIGPAEIRRRRQIGYLGLFAAVALGLVLLAIHAPAWAWLAVAIPAAGSLSGFIQARLRFCAGFGMAGLQNMGELGDESQVADAAARSADRRRALLIHGASLLGGLAIGMGLALLAA